MDDAERSGWIRRIQEHNELNGVVFSTVEFALVAVAGAFIAYAFAVHLAALAKGERGSHMSRMMFNSAYRMEVYRTHPRLAWDTVKLSVAVIVPSYLLGSTLVERWRQVGG